MLAGKSQEGKLSPISRDSITSRQQSAGCTGSGTAHIVRPRACEDGPPAVVLRSRRGGLAYGRPRQSIDALGQSHSTADASLDDL